MIKTIKIKNVASFKDKEATLETDTDKKINLIYGLNGVGKTIISKYLQSLNNGDNSLDFEDRYKDCKDCNVEGFDPEKQKILVYNQEFVEENFYESDTQKGIFTLNKDNKESEENIKKAEEVKKGLENEINDKVNGLKNVKDDLETNYTKVKNEVWKIKEYYVGGDRVFDKAGFFEGLKNSKVDLFEHLQKIKVEKLTKTIDKIEEKLKELIEKNVTERRNLDSVDDVDNFLKIEGNEIFQKAIVGNTNSTVSSLIEELKNSDWVKVGLDEYIDLEKKKNCPFCQKETLTHELVTEIQNYFDETYQDDIGKLKILGNNYKNYKNSIELINLDDYKKILFTKEQNLKIENLFRELKTTLNKNLTKINEKINQPSQKVELESSEEAVKKINLFIEEINREITEFNNKLRNKKATIENLKKEFWKIQREKHNYIIENYRSLDKELKGKKEKIEDEIKKIKDKILKQKNTILENRKKTTNIEDTIDKINDYLWLDFGIQDFKIIKDGEDKYKIKRGEAKDTEFKSLSEGEKTTISFLYFVELCIGEESQTGTKDKIIVIDDPISSLSHMYVFNVAQLIKTTFFTNEESKFIQCFVLTHSLYFFHELIKLSNKNKVKLFRVIKNDGESGIKKMEKNEIQNEYQSYWSIIKEGRNMFLLANAMRNIVEYFFSFIDKSESINNIFQKEAFKGNKYQSFCRYMNRESHSDAININDYKEFDLDIFKEAFKKIFEKAGYENHYKKMMGRGRA